MIAAALKRAGHVTLGWSNRSFDTVIKAPDALFERVSSHLKDGDIILFHDYSDSTISILSKFIIHARQKGYEIVRVDELVNQPAYR
jgi:peptidoglycan/xylan/chitin deacetylase (PgdA/CDA1 family)